jgi:hypothetical protein
MTRAGMWVLLVAVGVAAAVLSFSALRDLAILCGFHPWLAWLLPLVVDAGAGAGCLVWLGGHPGAGRRFARALTWTLLASSVAGNAVVHGLTAYGQAAPWWLVVAVSAIAPAVLGAVVHLAVLVGRAEVPTEPPVSLGVDPEHPSQVAPPTLPAEVYQQVTIPDADLERATPDLLAQLLDEGASRRRVAAMLGVSEYRAKKLLASRNGNGAHP